MIFLLSSAVSIFLLVPSPLLAQERSTETYGYSFEHTLVPLTSIELKLDLTVPLPGGPIRLHDRIVPPSLSKIFGCMGEIVHRLYDRYQFLEKSWFETDSESPYCWYVSLHEAVQKEIAFILRTFIRALCKHPLLSAAARTNQSQAQLIIKTALSVCKLLIHLRVDIEKHWQKKATPEFYTFVCIDKGSELISQHRIDEIFTHFSVHSWFLAMRKYERSQQHINTK